MITKRHYRGNRTLGPYRFYVIETGEFWPETYRGMKYLEIKGFNEPIEVTKFIHSVLDEHQIQPKITCRGQSWGSLDWNLTPDEEFEALHYYTKLIYETHITEYSSYYYCTVRSYGKHPVYNWRETAPGMWEKLSTNDNQTLIPAEVLKREEWLIT